MDPNITIFFVKYLVCSSSGDLEGKTKSESNVESSKQVKLCNVKLFFTVEQW
jgi:hypothetical protein